MFDPNDPASCIRYRIVYGEAARLLEMARFDHAWGRDFARQAGDRTEEIAALLIRQYVKPGASYDGDLIRLAVDDTVRKRRPRW